VERRVAELRTYVGFGDEDARRLAAVHDLLAPDFPRIAQHFYDKIREHEEAHAVFTGEDQIARLQKSLQVWLHRLLGGTYDAAYYEHTSRIGEVHVRVGLPQRYMFTAMALIRLELARLVDARTPAADAPSTKAALHKAIDLELAVMLDAYRVAYVARLERKQSLEREELATSLAQTEGRYAAALELTHELVIALDATGAIRLFNAGAEAATGFGREEVVGTVFADRMLADESRAPFQAMIAGTPETAERLRIDSCIKTRSGKLRDVRFALARTRAGEILLIGHDDTEEKELAERAHQTEKLAAVGTLAAGLAHEIRNPLNGAQLHVAYLERTLKRANADADTLEAVDVVGDEIKRLARLVTEFLDFARPKPLTKKGVPLVALLERVVQLLEPEAGLSGVVIVRDFPAQDIVARIDSAKIEQVVLNIGKNAVEAVAALGSGHVTLRLRRQPKSAVIEVEDDGPGMSDSDAPIFDAFFTTKPQGTGLGLAITHRIVTDHDGSIGVESRPGRTVFRVMLPISVEGHES
jgi:PAS domain S-box-containing protein